MAATLVDFTASNGASSTSVVLTKPSSLAVGDLMLAFVNGTGITSTISGTPSGWVNSAVVANADNFLFYSSKVADAGDVAGGSFTWTLSAAAAYHGGICRITGHNDALDDEAIAQTGAGSSHPSPSIGPTVDDCLIVICWGTQSGSQTWTLDAAMTAVYGPTRLQNLMVVVGKEVQASAAPIVRTSTTVSGTEAEAAAIAIAPGGGEPPFTAEAFVARKLVSPGFTPGLQGPGTDRWGVMR